MNIEEVNLQNRNYYDLNKEKISLIRKLKERTPEIKQKAIFITQKYREKNKEKYNLYQREYLKKNKKYSANKIVYYAVKLGILSKPEKCEICNEKKDLQGHHENYSKPLEVKWLCRICHCKQHGKLNYL